MESLLESCHIGKLASLLLLLLSPVIITHIGVHLMQVVSDSYRRKLGIRLLKIREELFHLGQELLVIFNSPCLLFLELGLKSSDLIHDNSFQSSDLLGDPLIKEHNILCENHFHLVPLLLQFRNALANLGRFLEYLLLLYGWSHGIRAQTSCA